MILNVAVSDHSQLVEVGNTHEKREEPPLDELAVNTDYICIQGHIARYSVVNVPYTYKCARLLHQHNTLVVSASNIWINLFILVLITVSSHCSASNYVGIFMSTCEITRSLDF